MNFNGLFWQQPISNGREWIFTQNQRRKVKDFFIKFTNKLHFAEFRCGEVS